MAVERAYSRSMAEVLLFHHAQGQTKGFHAFADELRAAGHSVHTPDLFEGKTFATLDEGVAYAKEVGFGELFQRGVATAEGLPAELVYAGLSLGVPPAQMLTQTRPGARGALLYYSAMPTSEFDSPWPVGVPVQIHAMEGDEWFEEDRPAAEALVAEADNAELFLYPGDAHLFADSSLPGFDEKAARLLVERTLAFLEAVG
jgi:dienelactone hydrolase